MISGLNQEVNVLGRTFHFQTELTRRGAFFIRTEVFVGGKIVATREQRLEQTGRLDEDAVRTSMKEQHGRVIESTLKRVESYQERKGDRAPAPPESQQDAPAFDAQRAENLAPPSEQLRGEASSAIRIRRIFGKLRLRVDLCAAASESDLPGRLQTASRGFAWIIGSPTFQDIRLDEQMRCHLVRDRVDSWLRGDRDPAQAVEIWSEIVVFNTYVTEINNRAELVEFDRQLLTWAAYQVQSDGISEDMLDHLQWLFGRDPELDKQLDQPQGVADEDWFALLCRVLAHTSATGL